MTVLDWLPSVAWAVFVAWSISRPEPKPAGRHRAAGNGLGPAHPAGGQPQPGARVDLHHVGRGTPGVPRSGHALHRRVGRHPQFHRPARGGSREQVG